MGIEQQKSYLAAFQHLNPYQLVPYPCSRHSRDLFDLQRCHSVEETGRLGLPLSFETYLLTRGMLLGSASFSRRLPRL